MEKETEIKTNSPEADFDIAKSVEKKDDDFGDIEDEEVFSFEELMQKEVEVETEFYEKIEPTLEEEGLKEAGEKIMNEKGIDMSNEKNEIPKKESAENQQEKTEKSELREKLNQAIESIIENNPTLETIIRKHIKIMSEKELDLKRQDMIDLLNDSKEYDHLAYTIPPSEGEAAYIIIFEKLLKEKNLDVESVVAHEIGHVLLMKEGMIFDKNEISEMKNSIMGFENLKQEDFDKMPPAIKEIMHSLKDPKESKHKESDYVKTLFEKLDNENELKKELTRHNKYLEKEGKKAIEVDLFKKIFMFDIAQEMLAERFRFYACAEKKDNGTMISKRLKSMSKESLEHYFGKDINMKKAQFELANILEKSKKEGVGVIKGTKFEKFLMENNEYLNLFTNKIGNKTPEELTSLFNSQDIDFEDFDDLLYGGSYSEGGSFGGSGFGSRGFERQGGIWEWLESLFQEISKAI